MTRPGEEGLTFTNHHLAAHATTGMTRESNIAKIAATKLYRMERDINNAGQHPSAAKVDFVPPWVCVGCSYIHEASAPKRYLRFGEARIILCTSCYLGLAHKAELLQKQLNEALPKLHKK